MGLSLGYTQANADGTYAATGDDTKVKGYHLGGYLSRTQEDRTIDASMVVGFSQYESQRQISFTGFSETVRGDYKGWSVAGRVEMGLPFSVSSAWSGSWLAGARAGYQGTEGYSEQGGTAAQNIEGSRTSTLQFVLGVAFKQQLATASQLNLRARYLHEFADTPAINASFVAGGPTFSAEGAAPNRDALQLGVSYRRVTEQGVTVNFSYDAEVKEKYLAHQLTAHAIWNF
jgi:outer membrane autotransporter protein